MTPRLHISVLLVILPIASAIAGGTTDVRVAAEEALATRFPGEAHHFEVRVLRTSRDVEEAGAVRVRFSADHGVPRAHTQVTVLAGSEDTGWRETGWAMLYIAHFDSVAIAAADRAIDDPVHPDEDIHFSWIETTRFRGEPLSPSALKRLLEGGAVFAARPLREGRPVRAGDLRPPHAADTGDAVEMTYERALVTLKLRCKAREPGAVGEAIRLYSADTQTHYRARLTGPGTATWLETL